MAIFQLCYVSSARKGLQDGDFDQILATARNFNPKANITGVLLFRGGIFLQLLEGERAVVEALFQNIQKDSRHANVTQIFALQSNDRIFTNWSMGYRKMEDTDIRMVNEILSWNKLILAAGDIDNHLILHMLSRFKDRIS